MKFVKIGNYYINPEKVEALVEGQENIFIYTQERTYTISIKGMSVEEVAAKLEGVAKI